MSTLRIPRPGMPACLNKGTTLKRDLTLQEEKDLLLQAKREAMAQGLTAPGSLHRLLGYEALEQMLLRRKF